MKTGQIHPQRWDDIVFEKRNKAYGAYMIRYVYPHNVLLAVIIAGIIIALVLAYPTLSRLFMQEEEVETVKLTSVKYTDLAPPPPIDKNVPPPPKMDIPPPVKTIIKFLPPKVTEKEIVEEEEMPTIEEIKQNDVGAETIEGTGDVVFDEPVVEVVKEKADEDVIFTVVEQQAEYPGGLEALSKFVNKNLKYPVQSKRMGVEGSVYVGFVVDKQGKISDVNVIKGISTDCDKEAIRVIQMMPPWKPGRQNGEAVKSRFVLPIKFRLG